MPDPYWTAVGEKIERRQQAHRKRAVGRHRAAALKGAGAWVGRICPACRVRIATRPRDEVVAYTTMRTKWLFCDALCFNLWKTVSENEYVEEQEREARFKKRPIATLIR